MKSARAKAATKSDKPVDLRVWLEREILDGRLMPGDRLSEQDVAQRFGISRTPVREALLQLGSMGLVSFQSRRGAVVARLSTKQIVAMREVLTELEALSAQLSARRMFPEERTQLQKIHEESQAFIQPSQVAAYTTFNRRFHEALYIGAKNDFLAQQAIDIRARLRPYIGHQFMKAGGMERSFDGHRRIVDAILAGDDNAAAAAMKEHILSGAQTFQDLIAVLTTQYDDKVLEPAKN